jgi:3-phenylpropionate/trans-cinnamate dioxygenase ferredoxin reductase subunit
VFAAGDVADHLHPLFGRRIRTEHWHHARKHGEAAARSIMGRGRPYDEVPWFWSDQYEHNVQYTGHHRTWERIVIRGSLEERSFVAFYLQDGAVAAAAALNRGDDLQQAKELIRAARPIDPARLGSESVALESV